MIKVKTFIEALNLYNQDYKKFTKFLSDKRLSQAEKTIIEGWMDLREVKLDHIINKLNPLITNDVIVESQKQLLLGIAHNNSGAPQSAVPHLLRSLELLKDYTLDRQVFLANNTLFIAYHNLKDHTGMARILEDLEEIEKPTRPQEIEILRRKFSYFSFIGKLDKAKLMLKKVDQFSSDFSDSQKINILIDKFDFAIKTDNFKMCDDLLKQMKNHRNFHLSANFKFMRKLLDLIVHGSSLYLYPKDFNDIPLLCAQVKVLLAMEEGNYENARREWLQMTKLSPTIFDKDFIYHGDKCLFSVAVNKLQPKKEVLDFKRPKESNNENHFLNILLKSEGTPISKEELFFELWGRPIESKEDLNKLVCTVYRLKTKHKLKIQSRKGCYILKAA